MKTGQRFQNELTNVVLISNVNCTLQVQSITWLLPERSNVKLILLKIHTTNYKLVCYSVQMTFFKNILKFGKITYVKNVIIFDPDTYLWVHKLVWNNNKFWKKKTIEKIWNCKPIIIYTQANSGQIFELYECSNITIYILVFIYYSNYLIKRLKKFITEFQWNLKVYIFLYLCRFLDHLGPTCYNSINNE